MLKYTIMFSAIGFYGAQAANKYEAKLQIKIRNLVKSINENSKSTY